MFPSCKRPKTDSSVIDDSNEWLCNITFNPDAKRACATSEDDVQTGKKSGISKSSISRHAPIQATFTIDRSADKSNLGANRSYFKTVPLYQVMDERSDGSALKGNRYFRQSCIRKEKRNLEMTVALPDTDQFSTDEWISLWIREQEDLRKSGGSRETKTKRLHLILNRIVSFGKRYPNRLEPRLKLIEFEIRKQLGESSCGELYSIWRRELRSRSAGKDEWMLCLRFGLASNTTHLRDIRKDFKEFIAIQLTNIEDSKAGTYSDYENLLDNSLLRRKATRELLHRQAEQQGVVALPRAKRSYGFRKRIRSGYHGLFLYALTMSDAGYHELGVGMYQALIDFNIGRWVAQRDLSIELYRNFWLSGLPRFGELGYVEWFECSDRIYAGDASSFTQNPGEHFHIDKDLSVPLQWLQNEFTRERADILPFRVKSDYLEDLERYISFSDLVLFDIPFPAIQRMLVMMVVHFVIVASPFGLYPLTSPVLTTLLERIPYMYDVMNRFPSVSIRFVSGCSTAPCSTAIVARLLDQLIERTKERPEMQKSFLYLKMSLGLNEAKSILANNRHNADLFASYVNHR